MKFFGSLFGEKKPEELQPAVTDEECMRKSKEALDRAWELLHNNDNWKLEKTAANGDTVYSRTLPVLGKVFKFVGEVNFPPKKFVDELYFNTDAIPKWNPTVLSVKRIKEIGDSADVIYYMSAPIAGGLISSRDFVCARHVTRRDGCFVFGGGSIQYPDVPVNSKCIRAETALGCHVVRPIPGVDDRCTFQWIMHIRLNGWLPQYLVDMGLTDTMFDYVKSIRNYGEKLRESGFMDS